MTKKPRVKLERTAHIASPQEFVSAFGVSRETGDRLQGYVDLLLKWQQTINLVAPSTLSEVWHRHIADSAQLLPFAGSPQGTWVDLGSGAGFPGMVLAILRAALGTGRQVLVESDARKCAFLAEVVRKTGIPHGLVVEILNERIENATTQAKVGIADVVTARALAPLGRLLELAHPLFQPHTIGLFLKGRDFEREIAEATATWSFDLACTPSRTDAEGRVIRVRNLSRKAKDR